MTISPYAYKKKLLTRYCHPRIIKQHALKVFFHVCPQLRQHFGYARHISAPCNVPHRIVYDKSRNVALDELGLIFTHEQRNYALMRREPIPDNLDLTHRATEHYSVICFGHSGCVVHSDTWTILSPSVRHAAPRNYIKARPITYLPGKEGVTYVSMLGIHRGHKQYYHFLCEYFLELWGYLDSIDGDTSPIVIVVRYDLSDVQQTMYAALIQHFPHITLQPLRPNEALRCPLLHLPHYSTKDKNGEYLPPSYRDFIHDILRKYFSEPSSDIRRKIYLSRKDAKLRRLTNEDDILTDLRAYDIESVVTAGMSLKEQFRLFQQTTLLVTTHGAGMANLLFMPKGAHIIEIAPKHFGNCTFAWMSASFGLHHTHIIGSAEGTHQAFSCKPENITSILATI